MASREIGIDYYKDEDEEKTIEWLKNEKRTHLEHDLGNNSHISLIYGLVYSHNYPIIALDIDQLFEK